MNFLSVLGTIGKVVGIIFLIIIALFLISMAVMFMIIKSNDAYKGDYTSVVENSDPSAPKALVIYQPKKSASDDVANQLAAGLHDAGYEVILTYPGKHVSEDISAYSLVAFGSPVYVGKPSTAVTDTMKRLSDYSDKTIILYCVGMSTEIPELDVMKSALNGKEADYTMKFIAKDGDLKQKAYDLGLKAGKESGGNK